MTTSVNDFFQRLYPNQTEAWAQAINQHNPDGSLRYPRVGEMVCALHFENRCPSTDENSPDYVPRKEHQSPKLKFDGKEKNCIVEGCPSIKSETSEYKFFHAKVRFSFGKSEWQNTVWKFHDFCVIQILRGINLRESRSFKKCRFFLPFLFL